MDWDFILLIHILRLNLDFFNLFLDRDLLNLSNLFDFGLDNRDLNSVFEVNVFELQMLNGYNFCSNLIFTMLNVKFLVTDFVNFFIIFDLFIVNFLNDFLVNVDKLNPLFSFLNWSLHFLWSFLLTHERFMNWLNINFLGNNLFSSLHSLVSYRDINVFRFSSFNNVEFNGHIIIIAVFFFINDHRLDLLILPPYINGSALLIHNRVNLVVLVKVLFIDASLNFVALEFLVDLRNSNGLNSLLFNWADAFSKLLNWYFDFTVALLETNTVDVFVHCYISFAQNLTRTDTFDSFLNGDINSNLAGLNTNALNSFLDGYFDTSFDLMRHVYNVVNRLAVFDVAIYIDISVNLFLHDDGYFAYLRSAAALSSWTA